MIHYVECSNLLVTLPSWEPLHIETNSGVELRHSLSLCGMRRSRRFARLAELAVETSGDTDRLL